MPVSSPRSHSVVVGGRRMHVASWGDPSNPPLLLVHGMRDHARSWDWVAEAFSDERYVVAPDLRGHGDSDWVDAQGYGMAAFVMDLADVVEAMGLGGVSLVGHSLGGAIALRYAAAFPDRVDVLCGIECVELPIVRDERDSPKPFPDRLRRWIEQERGRRLRSPRVYEEIADAQERMREAHPTLDAETIEHLVGHGLVRLPQGGWRWKYDNAARMRAPDDADGRDIDATLSAITCPTLFCYGTASWIELPPAERLDRLRRYRIMTFPDAGHWLHHESRSEFIAAVAKMLPPSKGNRAHA